MLTFSKVQPEDKRYCSDMILVLKKQQSLIAYLFYVLSNLQCYHSNFLKFVVTWTSTYKYILSFDGNRGIYSIGVTGYW